MSNHHCLLTLGFSLVVAFGPLEPSVAGSAIGAKAARPVVVELYTSQGCSSCPPADAFLGQLANRQDILAMSLPVTYWDMLGWRDTLASEANTSRQKSYAQRMERGGVYTPQVIVDGLSDVVGSRQSAVEAAINARAADMPNVRVDIVATHQQLHVSIGSATDHSEHEATIWMFRLLPQATVSIRNGENSGRTVTYRNVVRQIAAIGTWKGQPVTLSLPEGHDTVAVIVQQGGGYGRILGAALFNGFD